ncbi:MAG: hypothetical protein F4091_07400 [Acidimicrobiales bacterium]|nr:hypothetical protein [Acidimicrobiales bacterium]MYD84136.1 hypothetical protein [Acidimicrobiales bacterium]MYJ65273.1 hypothetical protein [Acidimicrobiales bacterium]
MPADPLLSLASSIHAGPGVYALLLGSGVSRAAGIPTGWEITLSLVERLAELSGDDPEPDSERWYRSKFESEPEYSTVVERLALSPDDRQQLLSGYIEPSEADLEQGLKMPTAAHHGIARLVADGYVRVIVTTNFDRLLETAINEAGVEPRVIASDDHARCALPLVHSGCTVIKVHGDYLWSDLKNTAEELSRYGTAMRRLLREVFDQYGLVVCGWSGEWDTALRKVLVRSPNRRFTAYWMHRSSVTPEADYVIEHRRAIKAEITDADTAFATLAERVSALASAADQAPLDTHAAVALLKRFLPNPDHRIRLHDLVIGEADRAIDQTTDFSSIEGHDINTYRARIQRCEQACSRLMTLLATGAYFSTDEAQDEVWFRTIQKLSLRGVRGHVTGALGKLSHYPTLLAIHGLAIGAAAADRIEPVARALGAIKVEFKRKPVPIGFAASPYMVLSDEPLTVLFENLRQSPAPVAEHVLEVLRPAVADLIQDNQRYETLFYDVEYLLGLASAAHAQPDTGPLALGADRIPPERDLPDRLVRDNEAALIDAGWFKDAQELEECQSAYDEKYRNAYYGSIPRGV